MGGGNGGGNNGGFRDGGPGGINNGFGGAWNGGYGSNWTGGWNARTTPFTDEEIRQYQREAAQRLAEMQDLRNQMQRDGQSTVDLDQAIAAMRNMQLREAYANLPQVALLQQQLFDSMRQVEFALRREVEGETADRVFTSGADAVPQGFRGLVEEYYRKLAGKQPAQAPATTTPTPPPPPR
jgi:hypothetical protein